MRALVARGHDPIGFVRPGSDRRGLTGIDVDLREGDLLDAESVRAAMDGVEAVMHVGAVHRNYCPDPDEIIRPAVDGTRNVLDAARAQSVARVVYTSTGATVGFAKDPARPLDESSFLERPKAPYIRAKVDAEAVARAAAASPDGPDVVILNPSGIFGPRDHRLTPATRAVVGLLQGDPAFLHLCITDVADVAEAHVRALDRGERGERYLVVGERLTPKELAATVDELGGVKPPAVRPPAFLLKFLIGRMEKKAAREGTDAPASRDAVDDLAGGHLVYDGTKSKEVLGMSYRPARDVLRDTFRWLLHVDALKPKVAAKVRSRLGDAAAPDPDWV
jgi:dihydroflavonol-4-reductase